MNAIKKLDNKIMNIVTSHLSKYDGVAKQRSLTTILAITIPYITISLSNDMSETAGIVLMVIGICFGIVTGIAASYEWRHFFSSRKKGLNNDKNYFFAESADNFRKAAFYVSLALYILIGVLGKTEFDDLRYILKSDFYRLVAFGTARNTFFVIMVIELWRATVSEAAQWSNKKHLVLVIMYSIVLGIVYTFGMVYVSGHGVI